MKHIFSVALLLASFIPATGYAKTECTLIISHPNQTVLWEDGDCTTQRSPNATFKIPLALMGYDSHLLIDEQSPEVRYKETYQAELEEHKKTTNPHTWLRDSVTWYSQHLTQKMGMDNFKSYVQKFDYGNNDVSGNTGQNDGLTQSWLMSSLQISPKEQVAFLRKFLDNELGVSEKSYNTTKKIMPEFKVGQWKVFGKTASGYERDANGVSDPSKPQGWFVGWAESKDEKIIFAKFITQDIPPDSKGGHVARDRFFQEFNFMQSGI